MFSQACVILFTGGDVCLSACWDTTPPRSRHPWEQTPPWSRHPLRADTPSRADTPPRADTPLKSRHPPGSRHPQEQTPPGADPLPLEETHPPEHTPPQRADTPPPAQRLGDKVNERAVRILLECNLVKRIFSVTFSYYLNGRIANVSDFTDVKVFDKLLGKITEAKNIVKSTKTPSLPLWIGEAADAYRGGTRNISDTYVSGFL